MSFSPKRSARVLAAGAALAILGTGAAIAISSNSAQAADPVPTATAAPTAAPKVPTLKLLKSSVTSSTGAATVPVNGYIIERTSTQGYTYGPAIVRSQAYDTATGKPVGGSVLSGFVPSDASISNLLIRIPVTPDMAGKKVVIVSDFFKEESINGTSSVPVSVKAGAVPFSSFNDLTDATRTITVAPYTTAAPPVATGTPLTTKDAASGATLTTVATDKADGDKSVATGGTIQDVVNYTGLNVGTIYVLQTQLFDKTTGKLVDWTAAKVFAPRASSGSETVTIPVPAESEGHELVVFQTIWAGADALVGKHLDKVYVRPGATPVVRDNNPNNPWETTLVKTPPAQCTVSGYVWKDLNKNGLMDADEEKVPGVSVTLRTLNLGQDNYPGTLKNVPAQTTNANGYYKFTVPGDLCGRMFVDFNENNYPKGWNPFGYGDSDLKNDVLQGGWATPIDVAPGQNIERVDAGLQQPGTNIAGRTCSPLFAGFTVKLRDAADKTVQTTQIDANGQFGFGTVQPGTYDIEFVRMVNDGDPTKVFVKSGQIVKEGSWLERAGLWGSWAQTSDFTITSGQNLSFTDLCGRFLSPLVLDLNGNGQIDTASAADQPAGATFDLLGTGTGVESGWTAGGDGFLVRPNADGTVTSNKNLFGGALGEGFAQLSALDTNADGTVTGTELNTVKIWVDANNDHIAQTGELNTLAAHGITSLNVDHTNTPVVNNGNVIIEHGTATNTNGNAVVLGDAYFALTGELNTANQAALNAQAAQSAATLNTLPAAEQAAITQAFATATNR